MPLEHLCRSTRFGDVAQLVEHFDGIERVRRSNRRISTRREHDVKRFRATCGVVGQIAVSESGRQHGELATAATAPRLHRGYQGFESLTLHDVRRGVADIAKAPPVSRDGNPPNTMLLYPNR